MRKITLFGIIFMLFLQTVYALDVTVNNYDPQPAEAGKFVNVWFKIDNPTSEKTSVLEIEVTPKDGLSLSAGEPSKKRVGIIGSSSSQTIQYRLRVDDNAIEGANIVKVDIIQGGQGKLTVDLPIEVIDKDILDVDIEIGLIRSDPTRVKPDDEFVKLDVTLQNLGDSTAKGVRATLKNLPKGIEFSESYSNKELVGNIDADGTKIATFYIDVDESVKPKEYTANLELNYKYKPDEAKDDYLKETVNLPVRISIKSIPLYNITNIEFNSEELRAGTKNVKMTVTIQNIGEEEGKSVRIKVYGKSEQPFDYDVSSNFVAPSLKPGETGQATLEFDIEEDATLQTYLLDFEIKNLVGDDVITYSKTIPVEVTLPKKKSAVKSVVIAVVIIGAVSAYFYLRKKKRTKKGTAKKIQLGKED